MSRSRRSPAPGALVLLLLLALGARTAPAARADGDPASDYLYAASAFVPYDAQPDSAAATGLGKLVTSADRAGHPIRVAVIASPEDLGSDTPLWHRPQQYADFLGTELSLVYQGELLVVMPNGLGVYHYHHSTAAQQRLLQGIEPTGGAGALAQTAQLAVRRLSTAAGHPLRAPATSGSSRASSSSLGGTVVILAVELLVCASGLAWLVIAWRCWRVKRRGRSAPGTGRPRLLVPTLLGAAALLLTGGGVAIAMLRRGSSSANGLPSATSELMGLFRYPRGHVAPNFTLTDQRGHRYSLDSFRGHVVVLEFTDSHCKNLCPIISHEYVRAAQELGRANSQIDFVSVNANPFHYRISDVAHYSREHGLEGLPNWHFLTGSPAQLRAVWRRYGVSVTFNKRKREVEHEAPMLFIDRQGRERWLATPSENQAQINQWGEGIAQVARLLLRA